MLRVAFEGPHEEFDHIRVLDANGDWQSEVAVDEQPFADLRLPFALRPYELVYFYRSADIIARQPLQIVAAAVSLTAPDIHLSSTAWSRTRQPSMRIRALEGSSGLSSTTTASHSRTSILTFNFCPTSARSART